MHELAIIEDMFRIILKIADENRLKKVDCVSVEIGEYRQVSPTALSFAFEAVKTGTIASEAVLDIEFQSIEMKCEVCGMNFTPQNSVYTCPRCSSGKLSVIKGMDIFIKSIEGE